MNTKLTFSSEDQQWATPQWLFDHLHETFGFQRDVCASHFTAKCKQYWTPHEDGLAQRWSPYRCWMNPPYGREIARWMGKADAEARDGATVVCLVPARVDTNWWWDFARPWRKVYLKGRLVFGTDAYWEARWNDPADSLYRKFGTKNSAPFPSALIVMDQRFTPGETYWNPQLKDNAPCEPFPALV